MAKIKIPRRRTKNTKNTAGKNILTNRSGRKMSMISQSVRNVLQCKSNTLKKKRCRKRTAHTKKCWIHLAKENNLRIKKSTIPNAGKGLFRWKKPFNRFVNISGYTGEKTTQRAMDRKYGAKTIVQYGLCDGPRHCIDAYKTTDTPARFANDARGSRFKNNSCFRSKTKNRKKNLNSKVYIK